MTLVKKINTQTVHLKIALLIATWLIAFLILIKPFDVADLNLLQRVTLMPIYAVIASGCYLAITSFQHFIVKKPEKWSWLYEAVFLLCYASLTFIISFLYYKSPFIEGNYNKSLFFAGTFLPIFLLLLVVLIPARLFFQKNTKALNSLNKLTLKGDGKSDILSVNFEQLISVAAASNYVEVYYKVNKKIEKKILRSTLKKIAEFEPRLLRVHRSHLINPNHFVEWKGKNLISVTGREVPISPKKQKKLKSKLISSQK